MNGFLPYLLPRTLTGRLATLIFLILMIAGGLQYVFLTAVWRQATRGAMQDVYWDLASDLTEVLHPALHEGIDSEQLKQTLFRISLINPVIQLFLLDTNGKILIGYPKPYEIDKVPIEPIAQFLEAAEDIRLPIYNRHPIEPERQVPFSAARIRTSTFDGYLYVPLFSPKLAATRIGFEKTYVLRGGFLYGAAATLAAGLIGGLLLFAATRRFRTFSKTVEQIAGGEFTARLAVHGSDEISHLGENINQMAETIISAKEEAEQSDALRRRTVAAVSHDLRSPITVLYAKLERLAAELQSEQVSEATLEAVQGLFLQIRRITRLVDDLFQLSKLEAAEFTLRTEVFSLSDLVSEEIIPDLQALAEAKSLSVSYRIPDQPVLVKADPALIQRVLMNLAENAVHYTPTGGSVSLSMQRNDDIVEVTLSDSGVGIAPEHLDSIFQPFFRTAETPADREAGTGLGLAIVSRALEAHGAAIRVKSRPGKGSTFCFNLPVARQGNSN